MICHAAHVKRMSKAHVKRREEERRELLLVLKTELTSPLNVSSRDHTKSSWYVNPETRPRTDKIHHALWDEIDESSKESHSHSSHGSSI